MDQLACSRASNELKNLMRLARSQESPSSSDSDQEATRVEQYEFWGYHKSLSHCQRQVKKQASDDQLGLPDELTNYLSVPVSSLNCKPLYVWDEAKNTYPQ